MSAHPWPDVGAEGRWAVELMEELLEDTDQSPEGLAARARELRAEAAATGIDAHRRAALALADRYDAAAAARPDLRLLASTEPRL